MAPANPSTQNIPEEWFAASTIKFGSQIERLPSSPSVSFLVQGLSQLKRSPLIVAAFLYLFLLSAAALLIPPFLSFSYRDQEVWNLNSKPSWSEKAIVVDTEIPKPSVPEQKGPEQPQLSVSGTPTHAGVHLKWSLEPSSKPIRIYRYVDLNSPGLPLADLKPQARSYSDQSGLVASQVIYYRVATVDENQGEHFSEPLRVVLERGIHLGDAKKIDPNASVGQVLTLKPHPLGTDHLGRDLLARLLVGARISLGIGFIAPLIFVFFGVLFGCFAGYFGGVFDVVLMRFADLTSTVPELLLVILLQVVMGTGPLTLVVALSCVSWARVSMQVRSEVLKLRDMEFIMASRLLGASPWWIVRRHLVPNLLGTIIVVFSLAIPLTIFAEAFLSFIGLGIAPPSPSWGTIIKESAQNMLTYPHQIMISAGLMSLTMLAFNLIGDAMRDAFDPRLRRVS